MKIIAVGWNYQSHNAEMAQKAIPQAPVVFTMPETALLKSGKPFFLPRFSNRIEYETELVFHISRLGKNIAPKFAHRYYDAVTVGIDFTARDLQAEARAQGNPWDLSKGFDYSAPIGEFLPLPDQPEKTGNIDFALTLNGQRVQQGNSRDMIFSIDRIIAYVSQFYTLKIGDIIFTGTPAGVGPVQIGDHLEGYIGEKKVLDFFVK